MTRIVAFTVVLSLASIGIIASHSTASAQINIGINIGAPPPPQALEPGTPAYYSDGRYYRYYNGGWYTGEQHEGPWGHVPADRVPRNVQALPRAYNRLPPGHVKKVARILGRAKNRRMSDRMGGALKFGGGSDSAPATIPVQGLSRSPNSKACTSTAYRAP